MTLSAFGMNLHAATTADGRDRKQLERICRYLLRPPFAHDAVTALPVGKTDVTGEDRKRERDRGHALAGKSTLNRLELAAAPSRLHAATTVDGPAVHMRA